MAFFCYIVANKRRGTIYIGQTDSLTIRIGQHKNKTLPGFTSRYGCDRLVWFSVHDTREGAILQERRLKLWRRDWKIQLIEAANPHWRDLYWETCGIHDPSKPYAIAGLDRPETRP
ncbi:MAG: GIY-YIG nuclease family protein [Caulobacteraceae bacterium]|nr:MAG: GIY-YIG nuclease family protein [Caulobacteraceae bacterium]